MKRLRRWDHELVKGGDGFEILVRVAGAGFNPRQAEACLVELIDMLHQLTGHKGN